MQRTETRDSRHASDAASRELAKKSIAFKGVIPALKALGERWTPKPKPVRLG